MAIVSNGDRDPAREVLGDLIAPPVMAERSCAACARDTAQAVGACGYGIGVGLNRGQRCGCRPTLDLQAIALNLD